MNVPGPSFSTVPKNPVIAVPGLTPRLPETTDGPVLVMVVLASTAKSSAVPRSCGTACAESTGRPMTMPSTTAFRNAASHNRPRLNFFNIS